MLCLQIVFLFILFAISFAASFYIVMQDVVSLFHILW